MKDHSSDETVIERLQGALISEAMPKSARQYAQHLLNRLSQPVRVSVLGARRSGKSELVNMFLGRRLMPKDSNLPTTEFVWGEHETMTVTAADGSIKEFDTIDLESLADQDVAFLKLELPAEILKRINLLEVVTNGALSEFESAVDWAVRRTDIALWCSQDFGESEQTIWSRVPDSLKDHAFLVLTKADVLSAKKVLSKHVADLESIVAEEFHSLFAVATLQAVRAHEGDRVNEAKFHASGGAALASEVLRHAERGRRADFDSAHMFLMRYRANSAETVRPHSKPRLVEDSDERAAEAASTPAPEPAPEPAPVPETPVPDMPSAPKVENVALFTEATRFLKRRGDSLCEAANSLGEGKAKPLIEKCVDAVEHLVDLFSQDESGCEASDAFIDELAEASDMMVLMQVEDGDGPAADAVTLLLQLRRDMEMQMAA
ncbi:MAG: hypothetical protein HKN18_12470 [Silicimonas sp.]|nr:hypothetical protein [Silicimonas sp.]